MSLGITEADCATITRHNHAISAVLVPVPLVCYRPAVKRYCEAVPKCATAVPRQRCDQLFNDDDLWEYAMTEYGEVYTYTTSWGSEYKYSIPKHVAIYNEKNELVMKFTPTTQEGKVVLDYQISKVFKMNGAYFVQIYKVYIEKDGYDEEAFEIWKMDMQETSVKKVSEVPARKDASIYDLNGRRYGKDIRSLRPGIYIQDGRKITVE